MFLGHANISVDLCVVGKPNFSEFILIILELPMMRKGMLWCRLLIY
ncbi:hypothetical protein KCTC52924_02582 [Arenibacter antarcticus]